MSDTTESKVFERLARIEAGMQTLLDQTAHIARLTESVTRMQERSEQHNGSIDILFDKIGNVEERVGSVDTEVKKWVNRGIGAYAVAGIFSGLIGFMGLRMVAGYEGDIRSNRETIVTLDRRMSWAEYELKNKAEKKGADDGPVR